MTALPALPAPFSELEPDVRSTLAPPPVLSDAGPFDAALHAGLVALCDQRPHVLAHAVRATATRSPLRPLGVLCGQEALTYAMLGTALFGLQPPGTGLTRAAVRLRGPVWIPSIAASPRFVRKELLARHGVHAGAAFPISVGSKIAVVIEVLHLAEIDGDDTPVATLVTVAEELRAAAAATWAR